MLRRWSESSAEARFQLDLQVPQAGAHELHPIGLDDQRVDPGAGHGREPARDLPRALDHQRTRGASCGGRLEHSGLSHRPGVRDPADPDRIAPPFDCDGIRPNPRGYFETGAAVPLELFAP